MNRYGNIKARQPVIDRTLLPTIEERAYTIPGEAAFPDIGLDIGAILKASGVAVKLKLTAAQIQKLNDPVYTPTGELLPSPVQLRRELPDQWQLFIASVHLMPWWKHNNVTIGNIIKAIRGYWFLGGWLSFKPETFIDSTDTLEDHGL